MQICSKCGRDIDAIGQDNMSATPGYPLCEDCAEDVISYAFLGGEPPKFPYAEEVDHG